MIKRIVWELFVIRKMFEFAKNYIMLTKSWKKRWEFAKTWWNGCEYETDDGVFKHGSYYEMIKYNLIDMGKKPHT